jgi:hypothetical protein
MMGSAVEMSDDPAKPFDHLQGVLAKFAPAGRLARSLSHPLSNRRPPAKPDESEHLHFLRASLHTHYEGS